MNKPDMFADPEGWEADLVRRLTGSMAADADRQQATAEGRIPDMVRDTEEEVFWDSFGDSRVAPSRLCQRQPQRSHRRRRH